MVAPIADPGAATGEAVALKLNELVAGTSVPVIADPGTATGEADALTFNLLVAAVGCSVPAISDPGSATPEAVAIKCNAYISAGCGQVTPPVIHQGGGGGSRDRKPRRVPYIRGIPSGFGGPRDRDEERKRELLRLMRLIAEADDY